MLFPELLRLLLLRVEEPELLLGELLREGATLREGLLDLEGAVLLLDGDELLEGAVALEGEELLLGAVLLDGEVLRLGCELLVPLEYGFLSISLTERLLPLLL